MRACELQFPTAYVPARCRMDDDRISPMTQMSGVGSRPRTIKSKFVQPTTLGGTVEKLEMGMTGAWVLLSRRGLSRAPPSSALPPRMSPRLSQAQGETARDGQGVRATDS